MIFGKFVRHIAGLLSATQLDGVRTDLLYFHFLFRAFLNKLMFFSVIMRSFKIRASLLVHGDSIRMVEWESHQLSLTRTCEGPRQVRFD